MDDDDVRGRAGQDRDPQGGGRRVLLAGATGLVGRCLLEGLLADPGVAGVWTLGRRAPPAAHPALHPLTVDFAALPPLPPVDEVYLALGTTIKIAGSQTAFRAIDFDANLAVARAARAAGARRAGLVSAMGADPASKVFYNRVKGELEAALDTLGFEGWVVARPSMLVGDRESLGQPSRPGERVALQVDRWLGALLPRHLRAIRAADVAAALRAEVPQARGRVPLRSGDMQGASARGGASVGPHGTPRSGSSGPATPGPHA